MMLIVLLFGLVLFGEQIWRARHDRLAKAEHYRAEERDWRETLAILQRRFTPGRDANPRFAKLSEEESRKEMNAIREVAENHRMWPDYTSRMAQWYERGASKPWESLGEEPPIPREIDGTEN